MVLLRTVASVNTYQVVVQSFAAPDTIRTIPMHEYESTLSLHQLGLGSSLVKQFAA